MSNPHKRAVARAFGQAHAYEADAGVQRAVAEHLGERIMALPLPARPRVLEIGCGTGFLTSDLAVRGLAGDRLVTDLSGAMVARCRARVGGDALYAAMDGEQPCLGADVRFDLICSSLAFQWFDDLPAAIVRLRGLLAPGGHLAFTTMAQGSFAAWRAAHRESGLDHAMPDYPALDSLQALGATLAEEFWIDAGCADARAFLGNLRSIGAHVPRPGAPRLSAGALRRVMRAFDAGGAKARYHVACCIFGSIA